MLKGLRVCIHLLIWTSKVTNSLMRTENSFLLPSLETFNLQRPIVRDKISLWQQREYRSNIGLYSQGNYWHFMWVNRLSLIGLRGGIIMATNFRISVHRNSENLHLKLMGDFDGTSAYELLTVLKRCSCRTSRVFIHTSCLRNIHPFGLNVFHSNLNVLNGHPMTLVFTGENASRLAPETPPPFDLTISTMPPVAISGTDIFCLSSMRPK